MSEFKYIKPLLESDSLDEALKKEQAHQLKRIADALEQKESVKAPDAFYWNFHIWARAYIVDVQQVDEDVLMVKPFRFCVESEINGQVVFELFEYDTEAEAEAEAARAEFVKLWEGK